MPLVLAGSLPVSAVNFGLTMGLSGLAQKAAKLQADVTKLGLALTGQLELALDVPPPVPTIAAAITADANPLELAAAFIPANLAVATVDAQVDLLADLAIVSAQLAVVEGAAASLKAGLNVGGLAGFSYTGPAAPFGSELERYTVNGFGTTSPTAPVQAIVIATESLASWQAFSKSVNTNGTANAPAGTSPRLAFLGELPGRSWNSGTASLAAEIDLLLADLRGQKAGIEASAALCLGVGLPDVEAVVDAGASVVAELGVGGLIDNLINANADITGAIGDVTAQIDAVLELSADIGAQLSAGGLSFWTYSGSASGLGRELRSALQLGLPGGSGAHALTYGLVIVGNPAAMIAFGSVFKTS